MVEVNLLTGVSPPETHAEPKPCTRRTDAPGGSDFGSVLSAKQKKDQQDEQQSQGVAVVNQPGTAADNPTRDADSASDQSQKVKSSNEGQPETVQPMNASAAEGQPDAPGTVSAEAGQAGGAATDAAQTEVAATADGNHPKIQAVVDTHAPVSGAVKSVEASPSFAQALAAQTSGEGHSTEAAPVEAATPAPNAAAGLADAIPANGTTLLAQNDAQVKPANTGRATGEAADEGSSAGKPSIGITEPTTVQPSAFLTPAAGSGSVVQVASGETVAASSSLSVVQQIVAQMEGAIQTGKSSLNIQLNPKELGGIELHLVSSAHGVSVTMIAEQASTGRMLEDKSSQLRQSLADSGVHLSALGIRQGGQGSVMSHAQQQGSAYAQHSQRGSEAYIRRLDAEDERNAELAKTLPGRSLSPVGVDYLI